ncbi:MAG TPA: LPS export ABC transporter periplasmic protein LptC [Bryobacteraceae bacterium]|nr:LPS export ABC transporter periplasmic protein LptC [Bryobacteraceae bacterium]
MRRIGPLVLIVILALAGVVANSWFTRVRQQRRVTPTVPRTLPPNTNQTAEYWTYRHSDANGTRVEVSAKDFRQVAEPDKFELKGMELHLYAADGVTYDKVNSASGEFDTHTGVLYSDGAVSITMGVPVQGAPSGKEMVIQSSGVHFESKTGKASTDRPASFRLALGEGSCVGASYDPQTHQLVLQNQVELTWRGRKPGTIPMRIEAGNAVYKEQESKVYLSPWTKLTRDTLSMSGGPAVVTVADQQIQLVQAQSAKGIDTQPNRRLEFSADLLTLNFDDGGQINHVSGDRNAHLVSTAQAGETRVNSDRLDLALTVADQKSALQTATAMGHAMVESTPATPKNGLTPERRVVRSDIVTAHMRAGGEEIDSVDSATPSTIEFIPVRSGQSHRVMTTSWMAIHYGASNEIRDFMGNNVTTRTDKPASPGAKQAPPPALTWSRDLRADFDPATSQMTKLEQSGNFRYEEGDRKAHSDRAVIDQKKNVITLTGGARMWDSTGTTTGNTVVLDQTQGDFTAEGNVNSTRQPDAKSDNSMLSGDEPLHARAAKMLTSDDNTKIRYEGNAVLWQGGNRIQADVVDIDRDAGTLRAHGHVTSQFLDQNDSPAGKDRPAVYTIVQAPDLIYTDNDRQAHYTGGATMERPDLRVKGREIRAFLKPRDDNTKPAKVQPVKNSDAKAADGKGAQNSSLDHAVADGAVEIVAVQPGRTRTGTSDHAEYFAADGRVVLTEGKPQLVDSLKGTTKGRQLTWFSQDDRLLVNGVEAQPAHSLVLRSKK